MTGRLHPKQADTVHDLLAREATSMGQKLHLIEAKELAEGVTVLIYRYDAEPMPGTKTRTARVALYDSEGRPLASAPIWSGCL